MIVTNLEDLNNLRIGGQIAKKILQGALSIVKVGTSSMEIERYIADQIKLLGVKASFLGYDAGDGAYPYCSCVSINHQLVHTLPSEKAIIKDGDLVTIDLGVIYKGLNTDTAYTIEVGNNNHYLKFLKAGKQSLKDALKMAIAGNRVGDISNAMEKPIKNSGYSVSMDLVGHGIGKKLHEPPQIPCYGKKGIGEVLLNGMVLAIEVMYMEKSPRLKIGKDGFSLDTADKGMSAQFEHTVIVKSKKCEILV